MVWHSCKRTNKSDKSSTTQSIVEIKNGAIIEHARFGVKNDDGNWWTNSGGIIKAENSTFRNNKISIGFQSYHNKTSQGLPKGNLSYITNCTFEVTSACTTANCAYKGDAFNYPFLSHISMWDVEGIYITGCKLYNNTTVDNRGYGILSYNAGYTVAPYCNGYWSTSSCVGTLVKSDFEGFTCGILAEGDLNGYLGTITVDQVEFDKNSIGIRAKNVQDITVLRSKFEIGHGKEIEINDCYQNAGTYTTNMGRFRIEENEYIGYQPGSPSGWINIGAITESSGENDNEIYKNSFTGLTWAAHAWKDNSSKPAPSGFTWHGLRYYCNSFSNNNIDIAISATYPDGIHWEQGSFVNGVGTVGTGNTWTSSSYSGLYKNISNSGHWLTFYHTGTAPSTISWNNTSSTPSGVSLASVSQDRNCDSKISSTVTQLSSLAKSSLNTTRQSLMEDIPDLVTAYTALIDDGNTDDFLSEIGTLGSTDAHTRLLEVSPYVSETVLRYAVDNTIMSEAMLVEVLQANPDAVRSMGISYLEEAGFDPDDFTEAVATVTVRTDKENEINTANHDLAGAYRLLFADLKNDYAYEYLPEIAELLTDQGTLASAYELADYYYTIGNTAGGASILNGIPTSYTLTTEEEDIHEAYENIRTILEAIKSNQQISLTTTQVSTLTDIKDNFAGKNVGYTASAMLVQWAVALRKLPCIMSPLYSENKVAYQPPKVKKQTKEISVYPNPAKNHVVFSYNFKTVHEGLQLTITYVSGKIIKEIPLANNKGLFHWYTNEIQNGVYFYNISDSKTQHGNGKVVIMK